MFKNSVSNFCLILFFSFMPFILNAEENSATQIYKSLENADKVRTSEPDKFSKLLSELSKKTAQMSAQENYYLKYLQAYELIFAGKAKEALPLFKSIISTHEANTLIKFRSRLTLINLYGIKQNWAAGLSHLSYLLDDIPKISDNKVKVNGLIVAAIFYNQIGQYNLGLKYAEQLEKIAREERNICMTATIEIESKLQLNLLNEDESYIRDAIALCKNEAIAANFIRSYIAKFNLENNRPLEVINSLTPYLAEIEATKYPRLIVEIYTSLAQAYWLQNDLENTQKFAFKSKLVGENIKTTQAVVTAYKLLYQVAKKRNKYQMALMYNEIYSKLDKTYINEIKAKHLAFQLAEHQAIEQKNRIDLLNEKNNLLTTEQELIKTNAENTRLIIMVLALTLLVLLFWGIRLLKAHKRIKQLAEYDSLTGIFNRGHFTQVAKNALRYCQSAEQELSLIMFDLDHFKKINDNYGHACGDWALKQTVEACKSIGRQNDIFARLGGEEFCILLTSCDKHTAMQRAQACRQAIANINTADSGFDYTITASFGVTDTKSSSFELEKLLADADSAAYDAKRGGRNQVSLFQPNMQTTLKLV